MNEMDYGKGFYSFRLLSQFYSSKFPSLLQLSPLYHIKYPGVSIKVA